MPYRFFFSYARDNRDPLLNRFYEDLSDQVKQYRDSEQAGFIDVRDLKSGAPWQHDLSNALRTAKTFVAICSPAYMNSEYCGKEFQFFLNRYRRYLAAQNLSEGPRLIQAVIWGPPSDSLHQAIGEFQYNDSEYPKVYTEEGLRYMMQLKEHEEDYKKFVLRLARKLVRYSEDHTLPDAPEITDFDSIDNAFMPQRNAPPESDGSSAWFVFVAGKPAEFPRERTALDRYEKRGGKDWRPFAPDTPDTVGLIAQATASKYKLYFEELPLDDQIEARIAEAETRKELVIVLVDPWTLKIPSYRAWMRKLDARNFENCVVLVPLNRPDPETDTHQTDLDAAVRDTFRFKTLLRKTMYYRDSIASARELRALLLKTFAEFSNRTVDKPAAPRVIKNRRIRRQAEAEGISLDKTPLVAAPGGTSS